MTILVLELEKSDEPSPDGSEEDVVEGFTVFVMNYKPVVEKIYTIGSLAQTMLDDGTFHISIDDVYIGFSDVGLTWEEFQIVLNSLKKELTTTENGEDGNVENESFMDATYIIVAQHYLLQKFVIFSNHCREFEYTFSS